jgi:hypothetical protein
MAAACFCSACEPPDLVLARADCHHIGHTWLALGEGARFVEHDRLNARGELQ